MLKRLAVAVLTLGSIGMALTPATANAQDSYWGRDRNYAYRDGYQDWRTRRDWREDRREEWREAERARAWREREWRERERCERPYYPASPYQSGSSFYFGYGR